MWQKNDGAGEENILQNQFTAYLLTAIKRRELSYIKEYYERQKFELYGELYEFNAKESNETDLDADLPLMDQIENPLLLQALLQAKERDRYILLARILDERSFIELAEQLGVSYKVASNSYYRLLERIRRIMKGGNEDE